MNEVGKKSLTAMILTIVSLVLCEWSTTGWVGFVFCIAGLVLAIIGLNMAKKVKPEAVDNPAKVFVKVATICGIIGIIVCAVMIVLGLVCNIIACSATSVETWSSIG